MDNEWVDLKINTSYGSGAGLSVKTLDFLIPLSTGFTGGEMTFEIYDFDVINSWKSTVKSQIKDFRLKDISFTVVDSNGNEINKDDIEYIGYMNQKYKNEGSEITIYQGTSKIDSPIEKASLTAFDTEYFYVKN
ncbi:MAG: hypothetical protein WAO52_02940 [Prolixibacteraceae bacterium]